MTRTMTRETMPTATSDTAPEGQRLLATLERLLAIKATNVKGALDEAADLVAEALGADKADAFLFDPATDSLVAVGTSNTPMGRRQHRLGLHRLPLANGGRSAAVYQTGVSYRTGHAEQDRDELRGIVHGLGVRSVLAVRIEVDGERRGVVQVDSAQPDRFSHEDLRFTEAVARWLGLVAQRAELIERVAREAAEQARRASAEELVTVLAHDLRTPLTPLRGYLDLWRKAARREGRPREEGYAAQATAAVERLGRMITDLLDAGRLDQGLFALTLQPLDLADLARDTADALHAPASRIRVEAPDDLVLRGDAARLRQALENLLGNALAHAPRGALVTVRAGTECRADGTWAVLSVRDTGPGIAPALLPTLFDRFARGSASTGLGLGLYLARGIAEAHGGALTVESRMGDGTTFHLALPLVSAGAAG